jgi:hypothetical protein
LRGVRLDLTIAVCALLISTLAASASWWQARVLARQTQVLEEQLGAQVWPYVSLTEGINDNTVQVAITNDGLGPAILRSVAAFVDGKSVPTYIGVLHAMLGPHLIARAPRGQRLGFTIDTGSPGAVVRPGDRALGFSLTSKRFAPEFLAGYRRMNFRICYCAIVPGKCWLEETASQREPRPVQACSEVPGDLLHDAAIGEVMSRSFRGPRPSTALRMTKSALRMTKGALRMTCGCFLYFFRACAGGGEKASGAHSREDLETVAGLSA